MIYNKINIFLGHTKSSIHGWKQNAAFNDFQVIGINESKYLVWKFIDSKIFAKMGITYLSFHKIFPFEHFCSMGTEYSLTWDTSRKHVSCTVKIVHILFLQVSLVSILKCFTLSLLYDFFGSVLLRSMLVNRAIPCTLKTLISQE